MDRYNADSSAYRLATVPKLMSLEDRIVVVTGAARGLGLAMAVGCAEQGATVIAIDILQEPTDEFELLQRENKIRLNYVRADITDEDVVRTTFNEIKNQFGPVTGLVNAAGIGLGGPFLQCTVQDMEAIWRVNVRGSALCAQEAVEQMTGCGQQGAIVNVSSTGGHAAIPGQSNAVYCASKGAILAFTKALAVEFSKQDVRVNSVSPGFFLTKATPGYLTQNVELLDTFDKISPVGRFADRHEIKGVVAFLLSPAASYVTGEDIAVDGGVLAV